jgi:hypothetical protein
MAEGGALCRSEAQYGQPGQRLTLADGDTVWVALQGAHVVSWQAAGSERLYLSPRTRGTTRLPAESQAEANQGDEMPSALLKILG